MVITERREKNIEYEALVRSNLQVYELVKKIKDDRFALNIYGPKRSGKTTYMKQALRYMLERDYSDYHEFECNLANVSNYGDCEYRLKEAMGVPKNINLQEALKQYKDKPVLVVLDNYDSGQVGLAEDFRKLVSLIEKGTYRKELIVISEMKIDEFGDQAWTVPALTPETAVNIFMKSVNRVHLIDYHMLYLCE